MRLIDRNDTSLAIALIASALVIFQRPLRVVIDAARAAEAQYHIDLISGLTVLVAAFGFHQYRKRQQARAAALAAEERVTQEQGRSGELERLVTFGRALGASVDTAALRQTLWRYLPSFAPRNEFWLLRRVGDSWDALLREPGGHAGPAADLLEVTAATAVAQHTTSNQHGEGVDVGGSLCFPMVVGDQTVGVMGVRNGPRLNDAERRALGAAAAFIAIALRNVQLLDETRENSLRDELTGCFNRAHAVESIDVEMRRARRTGRPLSLLLLDLDGFKGINDQHGHLAGDNILASVGRLLGRMLRATDIKCRYGGDEFLVILPDTPLPNARPVSEALLRELAELSFQIDGESLSIAASAGLAAATQQDGGPLELLARADEALYRAKRAGRNQVAISGFDVVPGTRTG